LTIRVSDIESRLSRQSTTGSLQAKLENFRLPSTPAKSGWVTDDGYEAQVATTDWNGFDLAEGLVPDVCGEEGSVRLVYEYL